MSTNYTNFTKTTVNKLTETNLLYKEESFQIIGAALEVHKILGFGFLEPVYQEALEKEFALRNIPFASQYPLKIRYKETFLSKTYIADFVLFEKIIVEIKALDDLTNDHVSQVLNYLKATDYRLGILINFGSRSLQTKRVVL
jgi:GxxExxY protein